MAGPWEAYQTDEKPSIKERAAQAGIERSQAGATASRASASSSEATAEETRGLYPARKRKADAEAISAEIKAEQAKIALDKARRLTSSLPVGSMVPQAREVLLDEIRKLARVKELSQTMFSASGIGYDVLEGVSGSPARTVEGLMRPILAGEAFGKLQEMRAASPTGGALGAVSDKELGLLQSSGGYVPPTAGDEDFQRGIDDLIERRVALLSKMGVYPDDLAQALGPDNAAQFAPKFSAYRLREDDEAALDKYVKTSMENGTFDPSDYAALVGQAYYNATGNEPEETFINNALDTGYRISTGEAPAEGRMSYGTADENARSRLTGVGSTLEPAELGLGTALGGAAINFIPSTFELAFDTVKGLTVDLPTTLEGTAQIIGGAVGLTEPDQWNAVKDYFADRYGSYAGFKRALREDPASIAADVAGIATGGGLLAAKGAATASKFGNIAKLADAAKAAEGFATAAARLDPLNTAAQLSKAGLKLGARTAENVGVSLPAKLLGVQSADVKQAAEAGRRGSTEFLEQLEGRAPIEDALVKADSAISELYQRRSADYTRRMNRLKKNPETLDFADVEKAIEGVRTVGRHKGIDISGAGGVWDEVDNKVMEFFDKGLNSIEDFDAMKRAIGNIRDKYQKGTPEYKVAGDVVNAINQTITAKAPIYANIMADYRAASDTLADVKSSLSLGAKSADTTLLKLRRSAGERGPRGRTVLDILEGTQSGKGLGDLLAAQNLSGTEPGGFGASMGAVGAVGTADPTLLAASAASPRALGMLAYRYGQGMGQVDKLRQAAASLPGAVRLGALVKQYAPPTRLGTTIINPALVQPQVDPADVSQPTPIEKLAAEYQAAPPELTGAMAGDVTLQDLAPKYEGISLGGFQPEYGPVEGAAMPTDTGVSGMSVDGREIERDPVTGEMVYSDTGEPVEGFKRGGAVKGYKGGGLLDYLPDAEDVKGFGRSVAEGALYGYNDNVEAGLRTLFDRDPKAYKRELDRIRREQTKYEQEHGGYAALGNILGGVGTAFVPGMQGLPAARVAQMGPKARAAYELALGTAQGGLYGTGKMYDDPDSKRDPLAVLVSETAAGTLGYPAARGAAAVGRRAKDFVVRRVRRPARR